MAWLKRETPLIAAQARRDGLFVAFRRVPQKLVRSAFEYAAEIVEGIQPDLSNIAAPQPRRDRGRNAQSFLQLIRGRNAARLGYFSYLYFNHTAQSSTAYVFLQERILLLTGIPL